MVFDTAAFIEECAGREGTRYAIDAVCLDIEEGDQPDDKRIGRLVATDGRMLAVLGVYVDEDDTPGLISKKAIIEARAQTRGGRRGVLQCGDRLVLPDGTSMPRPEGTFPNWREVEARPEGEVHVTFDTVLLSKLARASGARRVELIFDQGSKPILVRPLYFTGSDELVVGVPYDSTLMMVETAEVADPSGLGPAVTEEEA